MRFDRVIAGGVLVLASVAGSTALADTLTFTATMSGASERLTPTPSLATGFSTVTLSGNLLTVNEPYSGLTAAPSGAHIHCCADENATAPVEVAFPNFPSTTSGVYNHTFDLSTFNFGTVGFTEAQLINGLESGLAYVNIHDSNYPAGEIRGQLLPVASTPEPGTLLLLSTGTLGVLGLRRRLRV